MARFSYSNLQELIPELNNKLATVRKNCNAQLSFEANQRNGYTCLDLYHNDKMLRNLECGTPEQCYNAALQEIVNNIVVDI